MATTRTDPRVVEAMLPYFHTHYGNAASRTHRFGWIAEEAVENARAQVAASIGAQSREIVFTSGATEANNLAIRGVLPNLRSRGDHVVTSAAEHSAVLAPMKRLAREGWKVTIVPPDHLGQVSMEAIATALTDRTVFVSVMAANNEVGTLNPIGAIAALCRSRGIVFHSDATQAVGKVPLDVDCDAVDLLSLSAHKLYGPKGVGALFVRRGDGGPRMTPLFDGGGQERGLRSGTTPVPLIVGFGIAAELAITHRAQEAARLLALRELLHTRLRERVPGVRLNGHPTERLPGNLHVSFERLDGEALVMQLRDVAVSGGSACTSGERATSPVLRSMGMSEQLAQASLRFGIGRFNTEAEIEFAADAVAEATQRLRGRDSARVPPDSLRTAY